MSYTTEAINCSTYRVFDTMTVQVDLDKFGEVRTRTRHDHDDRDWFDIESVSTGYRIESPAKIKRALCLIFAAKPADIRRVR